ncbi:MAG: hypothetical protein DHS20C15_27620 [Planctomycetota bacterium]|nr:MAG: hypothetical protein DHS20C15_27620 [Planctomycetota bacterium]
MSRYLVALIVLFVAPILRADQDSGLKLLHQARAAARAGDDARALELIEAARIEWPGSPLVAHEFADRLLDDGAFDAALVEYSKGSGAPYAFRAAFNKGVARHREAETALTEAGVPADPQGLSDDADPAPLIAAIDAATPQLQSARRDFLEALAEHSDERARDSVAALTQRLDELAEMRERLEEQQQENDQEQNEDSDDQQQDSNDQDDQDDQEQQDDQQDPNDQQNPDDQQQNQDQQNPEGDDPEDDQQDEPEGQEEPPPEEEEGGEQDEQQPPPEPEPEQEQRRLTPQQLQELLATLDKLEEEAQRLEAQRRAANRRSVEKDW